MALFRQIFNRINYVYRSSPVVANSTLNNILQQKCRFYSNTPVAYEVVDEKQQKEISKEIIRKVNDEVANKQQGRLFAVVQVAGKQFKITEGDVIIIEGYWPPDVGDKISLDKVLLVGGVNFSIIGRPLVQAGLVDVHATVIEKNLSHTKTHFRKKRRKQYMRINFFRIHQTMLRVNKIEIKGKLNEPPDVSGLENIIL